MYNCIFKTLYIFERKSKKAKVVNFSTGINVITSNQENGNDVGKSIIAKSLYHTLGADSIYNNTWKEIDKTYLLKFIINNMEYYICRNDNLFRIYSTSFKKIFSTINRRELAEYLGKLFGFRVLLPNRSNNELELANPVYSYMLNYIDQDHMQGSRFASFDRLGQYKSYKENLLYNHFGIFSEDYFNLVKNIETCKAKKTELDDKDVLAKSMLSKVNEYLENMGSPSNMDELNIELNINKQQYTNIISNLKIIKNNLIKARNSKFALEDSISELDKAKKEKEKDLSSINKNVCPRCNNEIDDIDFNIRENSELEDFYILKDQLNTSYLEIERKIKLEEDKYKNTLLKLEEYESNLKLNTSSVQDVIQHKGYLETRKKVIYDIGNIQSSILENAEKLKALKKDLKAYNELKKKANNLYEEYMVSSKVLFNLKELSNEKLKSIKNDIGARGSNIPIATLIYYCNLLKVKYSLNPDIIKFPLVIDSPNNVELDDNKRNALFTYIFENNRNDVQLIVTTLGFNLSDYKKIKIENVVELKNEKYELLNKKDYEESKHILNQIFEN